MYITMKKAVARCSWSVARKTMPHVLVMYIAIYSRRAALAGEATEKVPKSVCPL